MKIVIAPDSFKGSLSAGEVARAIEEGIKKVFPEAEIKKVPLADGGEGTMRVLVQATGGKIKTAGVTGPLGEKIKANYGILGDGKTAVIEMAAASGLTLIPPKKMDPSKTTTYGTGELIKTALKKGYRNFIVGIGGSATIDGGAGMAQALGIKLLDEDGKDIGFGGGELKKLKRIDISHLDPRIKKSRIIIASDVNNLLYGKKGAAKIYGPQKGATPKIVKELDEALKHFSEILKRDLNKDVADIPGAGAAGGLGAGFMAFLGAELKSGADIVMEITGLEKEIADADLVITGEGKMDGQTLYGKVPYGVAKLAKKHKKKLIAICGTLGEGAEVLYQHGFNAIFPIRKNSMSLKESMRRARELVSETTEKAMRTLNIPC